MAADGGGGGQSSPGRQTRLGGGGRLRFQQWRLFHGSLSLHVHRSGFENGWNDEWHGQIKEPCAKGATPSYSRPSSQRNKLTFLYKKPNLAGPFFGLEGRCFFLTDFCGAFFLGSSFVFF
jgi:hypothetical protein